MTNEENIRLDQRVVAAEATIIVLQQRLSTLEAQLAGLDAKVTTLNEFYGGALGASTGQLLAILDKVTGGTTTTP